MTTGCPNLRPVLLSRRSIFRGTQSGAVWPAGIAKPRVIIPGDLWADAVSIDWFVHPAPSMHLEAPDFSSGGAVCLSRYTYKFWVANRRGGVP